VTADAVDIRERDLESLLARDVDAGDTGHRDASFLTLPLLVARVLADHPDRAMPADDLALVAHLLDRRPNLHNSLSPSLLGGILRLLVAVRDAPTAEVVRSELDLHPITRRDADVVHPHLPGYVRKHLVPVLQLDTE